MPQHLLLIPFQLLANTLAAPIQPVQKALHLPAQLPLYPATAIYAQLVSESRSRINACDKRTDSRITGVSFVLLLLLTPGAALFLDVL